MKSLKKKVIVIEDKEEEKEEVKGTAVSTVVNPSRMCDVCFDHQNQLLEDGDGSQVICNCFLPLDDIEVEDEEEEEAERFTTTTTSTITNNNTSSSSSTGSEIGKKRRRRRFLSSNQFNDLATDSVKRRIAPIKKWRDLQLRGVYRVLKVHKILANIKGVEKESYYVEMEDSDETLINAWITDIIRDELEKHSLSSGNVFIKPLGMRKAMSTGQDYHDFAVVIDHDDHYSTVAFANNN